MHDLDLDVSPGVTAILGPNGAGKTTLLTSLARRGRGDVGTVEIDPALRRGKRREDDSLIGFMPQHWTFFPSFTALESVQYAAWLKKMTAARARTAAAEALRDVGLADQSRVRVRRLSGGMQQRVGLAEALVGYTPIVLLDEPTVGLDPQQRAQFRETLATKAESAAVVLSTHLTEDAAAIADRILVFADGRIKFDGTVQGLAALASDTDASSNPLEAGYLAALEWDGVPV